MTVSPISSELYPPSDCRRPVWSSSGTVRTRCPGLASWPGRTPSASWRGSSRRSPGACAAGPWRTSGCRSGTAPCSGPSEGAAESRAAGMWVVLSVVLSWNDLGTYPTASIDEGILRLSKLGHLKRPSITKNIKPTDLIRICRWVYFYDCDNKVIHAFTTQIPYPQEREYFYPILITM